jgi:hypothetical protein
MRFSKSFQSSFLQPLFAGITLDDERKERSAFASFTFSAMSHGSMTMPKKGIEAVPKQLLARLKSTNILYNTTVESLSKDSVKLADGTELKADIVILATPQHVAQKLLGITNTPRRKETATYVFECQQTPLKRARLLLNTEYGNGETRFCMFMSRRSCTLHHRIFLLRLSLENIHGCMIRRTNKRKSEVN